MLLLIRVVMCRYRLVQIFWRPKCQRELFMENFLLYLPRPLFTNFWYRNFAQGDVHISFGGKIREVILNFFAKMLSGETLCKLLQIFPPKVLVYVWTNFSLHFFDYFMEISIKKYLKRIKNSNLKDWFCLLE